MRLVSTNRLSRTLFLAASLGVSTFSPPTFAQDEPAVEPPAAQPVVPPASKPKPKAVDTESVGPIQHLSAEAYSTPRTRGLFGGSLYLNHDLGGIQWPYYPRTGVGISGGVWVDTAYQRLTPGEGVGSSPGLKQPASTLLLQQGRFWLRASPTWSDGEYFVQGQAEFVAAQINTSTGLAWSADDMWIKAGKWNAYDVTLGRYEAWEVYHLGMGLDLYSFERNGASGGTLPLPDIYGVTYAFYRPDSVGAGAVHLYPTDWLRFELSAQYGPDSVPGAGAGLNTIGVRPVAVVDLGWLKLKAGAEYRDLTPAQDGQKQEVLQRGAGGAVQVVIDPRVEFGINGAYGLVDTKSQDGTISAPGTYHIMSLGGFANARVVENMLVGAGLNYTFKEDTNFDRNLRRNSNFDQFQGFGAIQYMLFKQLYIKGVFAYALADMNPVPGVSSIYKNEMFSGRLRLMYLF